MGGSGQGRLRLGLRPGGGLGGSPGFGGIAITLAAQVRAFVSETLTARCLGRETEPSATGVESECTGLLAYSELVTSDSEHCRL
jgi:hypothetical protein